MTHQPHERSDLTRWNRAGLTRFSYVDGDAASWLEELRIALLGLTMRGQDPDKRTADTWRDLFLDETDPARRAALDLPGLLGAVGWDRLAPPATDKLETRGQRRARLLAQYNAAPDGDHAWELLRAFARAAHVLTGHLDAYAAEGYLRTATQWDNLRRLAALANYQPTPPASASMLVALGLKQGLGVTEVAPGLAMKHAPGTGAPLIFETRTPLSAHSDLNAARPVGWDWNDTDTRLADLPDWIFPDKTELAPGDLVVFTDGTQGIAATVDALTVNEDAGTATIRTSAASRTLPCGSARLFIVAEDVRAGLPRPREGEYELLLSGTEAGLGRGDLIRLGARGLNEVVEVVRSKGQRIWVRTDSDLPPRLEILPLSPVGRDTDGRYKTGDGGLRTMFYRAASGVRSKSTGDSGVSPIKYKETTLGHAFMLPGLTGLSGYVDVPETRPLLAKVESRSDVLADGSAAALRQVSFEGKPPKALGGGAWLIERDAAGKLTALRVISVHTATGRYDVTFHASADDRPEAAEYHGPMKTPLRPLGWDRNPHPAIPGSTQVLSLTGVTQEAAAILRPGRPLILCDEALRGPDVAAVLTAVNWTDGVLQIGFTADGDTAHLLTGHLLVRLNAVTATHGETMGPKVLGSGDGEFGEQVFTLKVPEISHVSSTLSVAGVVPDIEVTVDDFAWDYRDFTDPTADGARAWSSVLGEDGLLRLHFRRRLPTGVNNVRLLRHRIGTGARGNGVPPFAIVKPSRKHPAVESVHQPFAASGGADREPVDSLRRAAPARLQANGRAVSLKDFERLVQGHASVWRARAEELATASRMREVKITVVPAGGGPLQTTLKTDLAALGGGSGLPGVQLSFAAYEPVRLVLGAAIRADLRSFDRTAILAAAQDALTRVFALQARDFGQPAYVAEVLAALETVPGITTATITDFGIETPQPGISGTPRRQAIRDGAVAAIFPEPWQVACLGPIRTGEPQPNLALTVEADHV